MERSPVYIYGLAENEAAGLTGTVQGRRFLLLGFVSHMMAIKRWTIRSGDGTVSVAEIDKAINDHLRDLGQIAP